MRAFTLVLTALALAASAPAAGGLLVTGSGVGTYRSNDGAVDCPGAPFAAAVLYMPDGRGSLATAFAGASGACAGTIGTTTVLGGVGLTLESPPLRLVFFCTGSEAAGLHCEAQQGGSAIVADVGPYAGPGSPVTLTTQGNYRFDGVFAAV